MKQYQTFYADGQVRDIVSIQYLNLLTQMRYIAELSIKSTLFALHYSSNQGDRGLKGLAVEILIKSYSWLHFFCAAD